MDTKYQAIRKALEEKQIELKARLAKIEHDLHRVDKPLDSDFEEQAVEQENDEVLDALDNSVHEELAAIAQALGRLDNGEYGQCSACGAEIPLKRLEVVPHTAFCIACAETAEGC